MLLYLLLFLIYYYYYYYYYYCYYCFGYRNYFSLLVISFSSSAKIYVILIWFLLSGVLLRVFVVVVVVVLCLFVFCFVFVCCFIYFLTLVHMKCVFGTLIVYRYFQFISHVMYSICTFQFDLFYTENLNWRTPEKKKKSAGATTDNIIRRLWSWMNSRCCYQLL